MDLEVTASSSLPSQPKDFVKCCDCGCSCSSVISSSSGSWIRSVKRKYDEFEDGNRSFKPQFDFFSNPRVQIENECAALRETVSSQQLTIQELFTELDEERNASSTAANEAMSMILRLQREKAATQMEARQFQRYVDEKTAHDQREIQALEYLLYKREQAIQSLACEAQAYKHRMLSYGLTEDELEGERRDRTGISRNLSMTESFDANPFEYPAYNYPPLICNLNENPSNLDGDDDIADIDKYAFGETPRPQQNLQDLEFRINQMEKSPNSSQLDGDFSGGKNVLEKTIDGYSPRRRRLSRMFYGDDSGSPMGTSRDVGRDLFAESPTCNSFKKRDYVSHSESYNLRKVDNSSDFQDDTSDRVYTIDSVYSVPYNGCTESKVGIGNYEDNVSSPRDIYRTDISDPDVKKLYMRLQALEADRESMRQAIISMRTDKAQMVLLKEIAQHLCKEMSPERRITVKKPSFIGVLSFMSIFKWIVSFIFWRKKAHRSKYMCGLTASNVGLLLLLDKGPRTRQWRCLSSTQV